MYLSVNGQEAPVRNLRELRAHLSGIRSTKLSEVVLTGDHKSPSDGRFFSLIVMIHDDRAFLTYFRYDGDAGLNSCDPTYQGPRELKLDFRFSNGEVDPYPVWWTVPTADALRALEYTVRHGEPAPSITWKEADELTNIE